MSDDLSDKIQVGILIFLVLAFIVLAFDCDRLNEKWHEAQKALVKCTLEAK